MHQQHFRYWIAYAMLIVLFTAGCLPQSPQPGPTPTPTVSEPTPIATEEQIPPIPVPQLVTQTPLPTNTPPPTATPFSTNTPIPPTETPLPTPTEDADSGQDQIEPDRYAVVGVASDDVLNVRSDAGVDNDVVGELPFNGVGIELIGEDVLVEDSPWREISYGEINGWVNRSFLALQYGEPDDAADTAHAILTALKDEDFETLATFVHPEVGVRFSPYTYVQDEHLVFSAAEVADFANNSDLYRWGTFDGIGGPIDLTIEEYVGRFIYDVPFERPHSIGFNTFIGYSSTINNQAEYYPDSSFVEYHFPGFEEDFGGLDWRSLRIVMEEVNGEWKLVGIVHSEWTT